MKVFAYRNIKSEIMKSSSGGAFIRICQEFEMLHGKGNVAFYGASMLEDMSVRHLGVYGAEQCHIFQGAKYVRSDFSQCIGDIEKDLRAGKWVLVSGTPCQIYGIKNIYKRNNLIQNYLPLICFVMERQKIRFGKIILHGWKKIIKLN